MSDVAWMLGDGVSHDANVPRWATAALAGDVGGVCGAGHLAVSQDDTPGMRVKVAAGYVLVRGGSTSDQGMYAWWYPGGTVDVAPGDPSNPRDDIVGVQVEDDFWDASSENRCRLVVVSGTPAGAPVDPSLPPSFTRLARVRVDANESTSIVNGDLTDLRTFAGDYGVQRWTTALLPKQYRATGSAQSGIGSSPVTVCSLAIPAQSVDGKVSVQSFLRFTRSTVDGVWSPALAVSDGVGTLCVAWPFIDTGAVQATVPPMNASFDIPAGASRTITMRLTRSSGTATASTDADYETNHIDALWTATV